MIAGRRERRRTLIRASATKAIIARNLSMVDGVAHRQQDQKNKKPDEKASMAKSASEPYSASFSQYSGSTTQLSGYLQQLLTLHLAGILTDEEFSAARNRLFGS